MAEDEELSRAGSLFVQKRYKEAELEAKRTIDNHPHIAQQRREKALRLINASFLVDRIENVDEEDGVTKQLRNGWYKRRLQDMVNSGKLQQMNCNVREEDSSSRQFDINEFPTISATGCDIVSHIERTRPPAPDRGELSRDMRGMQGDKFSAPISVVNFACEHGVNPPSRCYNCPKGHLPPVYSFPAWTVSPTDPVSSAESEFLDVQHGTNLVPASTHLSLQKKLEILGENRPDSPAPKYHNIIDPNVGSVNGTWVPTEFKVSESHAHTMAVLQRASQNATGVARFPGGFLQKALSIADPPCRGGRARAEIMSPIPDLDPHRNAQLYLAIESVFEAALPLLARLRLPPLLLPGPLQAVVKAQRIVLKNGELYSGVWHEDGLREHVVAVALYYYRVSPTLQGGDMEIASKEKTCVLGVGDNVDYHRFSSDGARKGIGEIPRCKVPISEGTLLVFGNYDAVHRVLPMQAVGGAGSRDFLAFFVIDQRRPLRMVRELGPLAKRKKMRASLLRQQLQPQGRFGMDGADFFCTGNGCYSSIAWLSAGKESELDDFWRTRDDFFKVSALASQLNAPPPVLGRGISFVAQSEYDLSVFDKSSRWVQYVVQQHPGRRLSVFSNIRTFELRFAHPKEGVAQVLVLNGVNGAVCIDSSDAEIRGNLLALRDILEEHGGSVESLRATYAYQIEAPRLPPDDE